MKTSMNKLFLVTLFLSCFSSSMIAESIGELNRDPKRFEHDGIRCCRYGLDVCVQNCLKEKHPLTPEHCLELCDSKFRRMCVEGEGPIFDRAFKGTLAC